MFIDEITLHLKAGRGGDGVVRWRHEKGKDHGGPSGGNGGKGGDVWALAVRDIGILSAYRNVGGFEAGRGEDGAKDLKQGGIGKDVLIKLPVGSRLTNLTTGFKIELLKDAEKVLLLRGGRGGLGNEHFKGSTNIRPKESTPGVPGEEADFHIELLLVVDVGIIGLPNAGKSSILNALTKAKAKIGSYQFTTLTPNLGDLYGFIIADIPGLIHGASEGKGLGHKFLRHISRTKMLMHCISCENDKPLEVYKTIREELKKYDPSLLEKPEIILLTKTDLIDGDKLESYKKLFKKSHKNVLGVSIIDDQSVKSLSDELVKILGKI